MPVTALKVMRELKHGWTKGPRANDHDQLLRDVARRYRELTIGPNPYPAPNAVIASELFKSVGYIKRLVNESRSVGYLGPAIPGRAGELSILGAD